MTKPKKLHHLVTSDDDWSDRYQVVLYDGQDALIAKATVYYPKDPERGWLIELGHNPRGYGGTRGWLLVNERYYYDGYLSKAKEAANEFINVYKNNLRNEDGQSIRFDNH